MMFLAAPALVPVVRAVQQRKKNKQNEGRLLKITILVSFWTVMRYSLKFQAFLLKKLVFVINGFLFYQQ
jgi:hypothetical protein